MSNESAAQKYNTQLLPILEAIEKVLKEDRRCVEVDKMVATEIDKRLKLCKDPAKNPDSLVYVFFFFVDVINCIAFECFFFSDSFFFFFFECSQIFFGAICLFLALNS